MLPVVFNSLINSCNIIKKIVIMTQYFITLLEILFRQNGES
ncbi:hypothetical protein OTUT144_2141 [Orientia tsutsugamushi str. UT144]|uniref:Uncharacterized protein n=1 Tax=Orientia tsutsugamushi str. UT144 TaxID=1441384 RepID=A0A0F3RHX7_ORITS|nr:hypothetical protein OTUT144_2141 [Orientia tsutsugamushi str. UT144]